MKNGLTVKTRYNALFLLDTRANLEIRQKRQKRNGFNGFRHLKTAFSPLFGAGKNCYMTAKRRAGLVRFHRALVRRRGPEARGVRRADHRGAHGPAGGPGAGARERTESGSFQQC